MTTLNHYQGTHEILRKLEAVHARRWTLRVGAGIMAVATVVLGCVLVAAVAAGYWRQGPPAALRWALLLGALAAIVASAAWFLARAILWRQTPAQVARSIEQQIPALKNDLINSVLLAGDRDQASPELVQQAIYESVRSVRQVDLTEGISLAAIQKWGISLGATILIVAIFAAAQPTPFGRGMKEIISPSRSLRGAGENGYRAVGKVEFLSVHPGNKAVFPGDPVNVAVEIHNAALEHIAQDAAALPHQQVQAALAEHVERMDARVLVRGRGEPVPMKAASTDGRAGRATFTCQLAARAKESLEYAVEIGGQRNPQDAGKFFALHVVKISQIDIGLDCPAYTKVPPREITRAGEDDRSFEAPVGTSVRICARLSAGVTEAGPAAAALRFDGRPSLAMTPDGAAAFWASWVIDRSVQYQLQVRDSTGRVRLTAPVDDQNYRIKAIPDEPPTIKFVAPNRDVSAAPGQTVPTQIGVSDDYGLTDVTFYAGREGRQADAVRQFEMKSARKGRLDYEYRIPPDCEEGSVIVYYAEATDNRQLADIGGPQTFPSAKFKIFVQNAAALEREKSQRHEELRQKLLAILRLQEAARVQTEICRTKHPTVQQVAAGGKEILTGQEQIKESLQGLAFRFPFDADMVTVQQALAMLARDDAQLAIDQAKALASVSDIARREGACRPLAATQDRIIDSLRTLLAILPSLAAEGKRPSVPGEDLPAQAKEKLAALKKELEKFISAQRKIIESSERLAKTPVDNFTPDDEKLLKALQDVQDAWDKFLNEALTDFSKLPQQDFSNPAMLKELVSVRSDVTMAKDALQQKAVEIATAFEDNGIENAKSLTANIEKWLPDTPDRTKWSMEPPAGGQENIEQAELPKELEDLVGDLLEQEEDLFKQADDVTSQYAMSGDKGIGWDAADGPISNMNAQGVTGNQLPNTSEMGGRSGEGRSGKSSGEFVEDKAVGKGGRRTPARLTPEPFQKGQVDDKSTEPPGGATGGGKVSGAGAEGLEGPVPPKLAEELKRLAGTQATIVNKAERIRAKFQVNDYANFKLFQAITLMSRVKGDLASYRYRNVLRAREETLSAIRQTQLVLGGKVDVTADKSQTMPKYVRDDIADAMKGELPEKFRKALEQYYRRLSEQAGQ
ncbi:MAG TPA: hypothetical protein VM098_08170 [Phycisphaerae bacterium]|nr:hypothetical protein [Phycisphaerae bacterium]